MIIFPFRYSLSSFRYYVYVPLLFIRYYVSVTSWVRSVTICFRSVTIDPLLCVRYYLSKFGVPVCKKSNKTVGKLLWNE